MNNLQKLEQLLKSSIFLSEEVIEQVLSKINSLPEAKINALIDLLEKSQEKQKKFIAQALENNPNLLSDLNHLEQDEFMKRLKEKEVLSDQKEEKIIEELENILENLDLTQK